MAHRYNQFSAENPNYWMGAMRSTWTDGEWMWVKGNTTVNPIRAFWSSRDPPGDFDGTTRCVMFDANSGWLWRASDCDRHLNWVCEFGPRSCGNPSVSSNSTVQYSSTDVGSVAVYGCTGGLYLRGHGLRRCQPNGKWSDQAPVCTNDGCGPPPTVENGDVTFNETRLGGVAQYTCSVGYKPVGQTESTCNAEGSWTVEPPLCVPVDCGPAPGIPHGAATLLDRQTAQGSQLEYKCYPGYRLIGNSRLVCAPNEFWAGAPPFCQPDDERLTEEPIISFTSPATVPPTVAPTTTVSSTTSRPTTSSSSTTTRRTTRTTTTQETIRKKIHPTTTHTTTHPTTTSTTTPTTTTTTTPTTTSTSTSTSTTTSTATSTSTSTPTTTSTTTTTTSTSTTTPTTTPTTTTTSTTTQQKTSSSTVITGFVPSIWQSAVKASDALNQEGRGEENRTLLSNDISGTLSSNSLSSVLRQPSTQIDHLDWSHTSTSQPSAAQESSKSSSRSTTSEMHRSDTSSASLHSSTGGKSPFNYSSHGYHTANGSAPFNISDRSLLESMANQFAIFTPAPVHTPKREPLQKDRFVANNAMMRDGPEGNWEQTSSSSDLKHADKTSSAGVSKDSVLTQVPNVLLFNVAVDRPVDTIQKMGDSELNNDKSGRSRTINDTVVLSSTEIIMPKVLPTSRGIGGWIALGVILGLLLLILLIILIACLMRRKRRREAVQAVSSTHIVSAAQYDTERESGANANAFSSRYRKAWDNLQFQVDDAGAQAGGKDTPVSQTTFKSTGPRMRDENPVKAGSEIIISPSRAGTVKSMGSVGGISEALNESDEILIDQETALVHHRHGNTPDGSLHQLPLPPPPELI